MTGAHRERLRFQASASSGEVSALLLRPEGAHALYAFAHGAGAGMEHPFMESVAEALAGRGVATFRYHFPYMEAGKRRPDFRPVLLKTVESALAAAAGAAPDLPLFAGGKSMGGRMTSGVVASGRDVPGSLRGLVFFGFPLHPAGKPGTERAEHLPGVPFPMLFLQGTRDALADLDLLRPELERLGERAFLHAVEGADHGFRVLKRSGRTDEEVIEEMADVAASWIAERG